MENALSDYDGTLLIVSHDRYFINKLATKIYRLEKDGAVEYKGNYDYYISKYVPNEVDKERFILYMVDSNYVYITLSKIEKINKYNSIVKELEGKKGIIYLDSGDYVEIKG